MKARFSNRRLEQRIWDATERHIKDKYWSKIERGQVVFDIGADFGAYTIPAALNGAMVYAFEPRVEAIKELRENSVLNAVSELVKIVPAAVTEHVGNVVIGPPDTKFQLGDKERATVNAGSGGGKTVEGTTIDAFVTMAQIKRVDWIKMDIEGSEMDALRGGTRTIQEHKPNIIIECHENYDPDIEWHVRDFVRWLEPGYIAKKETDIISDLFGLLGMRSFHYVFSVYEGILDL